MEDCSFEVFDLEADRVKFLKDLIQDEYKKFPGDDFVIGLSGIKTSKSIINFK